MSEGDTHGRTATQRRGYSGAYLVLRQYPDPDAAYSGKCGSNEEAEREGVSESVKPLPGFRQSFSI